MAKDTTTADFSAEDAALGLAPAQGENMTRVRHILRGLQAQPPQVLLLEGGTEGERQAIARWWAALMHCEDATGGEAGEGVCGRCPACLHIGAGLHLDVLTYDGRISNKEDEENPGPVRAFNMDNARALKSHLGDSTRSGKRRVVILGGMDMTRDAAANALLKVLEEPSPTTIFVLLAPQREQLLPTLVSRSWVITLPWPDPSRIHPALIPWSEGLAAFLAQGRGWWQLTSAKGAVDQDLALHVVLLCQKILIATAGGKIPDIGDAHRPLQTRFAQFTDRQRLAAARLLEEAQEALQYNVNPARVLDWIAVRLFTLPR